MTASTAWIEDQAVTDNSRAIAALAPTAALCAVVKADGYGHGAVPAARAAVAGGASWLAVSQVPEAAELRAAGVEAPILVLAETAPDEIDRALALGVHLVAHREAFIDAVAARARACGTAPVPVHLKIDTGMRRIGCEPVDALALARRVVETPELLLAGTMTHLAVADEPDNPTTDAQLDLFDEVLARFADAGIDPGVRHAANSAAAIAHRRSHYDLVRVGIALYGVSPGPALDGCVALRPALSWTSVLRTCRPVPAGARVSYGHRHEVRTDTVLATVPVGYADGVRRDFGLRGGQVLVGGQRCPVVGVVTMDQLMVDVGTVPGVSDGDPVVLIGTQGDEEITAAEVAEVLDTIGYEVTCSVGARVAREHR